MAHSTVKLDNDAVRIPAASLWRRLPAIAGTVGVVALGVSAALGWQQRDQLMHAYLVAFLFGLSLALGGLFFVLVQYASRAGWSVTVRRLAENAMATLPLFALLFVPIALFGIDTLYHHWSHPGDDAILLGKQGFLNPTGFYLRAAAYFAVWIGMSTWFYRRSTRQDEEATPAITRRMQSVSAPALVLFALSVTYASIDWIMSLDPHWFSTMFGVYFFAGCAVASFAVIILAALALRRGGFLAGVVTGEHFHDLGKLLFAFVVFWAYIAFSQFMLIWYGNIPEETEFFVRRWQDGWEILSVLLAAGHFGVPFLFLLPQRVKRNGLALTLAALWLLFMHYLDLYWLVMPSLHPEHAHLYVLDVTCLIGVVALFVALFAHRLVGHSLVPVGDPRLAESLAFENL